MNKDKKITNIHDYSKEVDKIIATKKPVHEQLMAMLELVGGRFIDCELVGTKSVTSLPKQDKPVPEKLVEMLEIAAHTELIASHK